MKKWEYRTDLAKGELSILTLRSHVEKAGEEGWELCTILQTPLAIVTIFKREKSLIVQPGQN